MRLLILGLGVFIGVVTILVLLWKSEPDYATATKGPWLKVDKPKDWPASGTYTEYDGTQWSWTAS